ncbi:DUF4163 domain-containing protein [Parasphingorhabdus sp. JC815]|uniref:PdaC/SigV domain-containing protein n=1 Tax=Parasphingorhabdus sp. JC815 TaxID=3232140 RepID=UPI003458B7A1
MHYRNVRNLMGALLLPAMLSFSPLKAATDDTAETPETYGITAETENHRFLYSYPKALAREPALSGYLSNKALGEAIIFSADSDRDHAEAVARMGNGYRLKPYDYQVLWTEEAETSTYISLSRSIYQYLGGAHGMSTTTSLLWDKNADGPVETMALFGAERFDQALQKAFCEQLNIQRAEKRGHPVDANSEDGFDACITPSEQTVILGSAKGARFDTVSINVAPYEAGPYVEGSYQVDLPVTRTIISAVKPEYRKHFAIR